ncbi:MAG: diguanylate cyclase [Spirochaetaceae bacterium]|nr:diguanylate cyclase [Spirochaetaceae bacterium]
MFWYSHLKTLKRKIKEKENNYFLMLVVRPLLLVFIPFLAIFIWHNIIHPVDDAREHYGLMQNVVFTAIDEVTELVEAQYIEARQLINMPEVRVFLNNPAGSYYNEILGFMSEVTERKPYITDVLLVLGRDIANYRTGDILVSVNGSRSGNVYGNGAIRAALTNNDPYRFSELRNNQLSGEPPLMSAIYQIRYNDQFFGLFIFEMDMMYFRNTVRNSVANDFGRILLVNSRDLLIPTPDSATMRLMDSNQYLPPIRYLIGRYRARQMFRINDAYYFFYTRKIEAFTPIDNDLYLVLRQRVGFSDSNFVARNRFFVATGGVGGSLGVIALILFVSYRFYRRHLKQEQADIDKQISVFEKDSTTDKLTDLLNRNYLHKIEQEINASAGPHSLISCDLDGLKLVNDALGHHEGDKILKNAALVLKGANPKASVIRLGGDEFIIPLPNVDEEGVRRALTNTLTSLNQFNILNDGKSILPLYISFGEATYEGKDGFAKLLSLADSKLYSNKSSRALGVKRSITQMFLGYLDSYEDTQNRQTDEVIKLCLNVAKYYPANTFSTRTFTNFIRFYNLGFVINSKFNIANNEDPDVAKIGYRITSCLPEISGIAHLILKSGEHYDGSGPQKLKAEEIPLKCRIFLACRDFQNDLMQYDSEIAVLSLKNGQGTIYDPNVVDYLIDYYFNGDMAPYITRKGINS